MPTISDLLAEAAADLAPHCDSARLDSELMLAFVLDKPRSYLYAHADEKPDAERFDIFVGLVQRRCQGEPLAYITGRREFWSMDLVVNRHTLIPRPETEVLVEQALARLEPGPRAVLDLGTGSGAIALALAGERPEDRLVATDISAEALAVARFNASRLDVDNIEFLSGNWFEPVVGRRFDLIASNPPYVADGDPHLELNGLPYEPISALVGGEDGLDCIRSLAREAPAHLNPGGYLLIEHGYNQAEQVASILAEQGFTDIRQHSDMAGIPRVSSGKLASSNTR
ncbi:MAG: peptide chain release factor N(5)-glutamine methyltransferase [Gammaproteobacteria bacterium]|nr:peptide chain release factor N(5)-glutamine methyltransferase [Gammaproteobacteria bacterium]